MSETKLPSVKSLASRFSVINTQTKDGLKGKEHDVLFLTKNSKLNEVIPEFKHVSHIIESTVDSKLDKNETISTSPTVEEIESLYKSETLNDQQHIPKISDLDNTNSTREEIPSNLFKITVPNSAKSDVNVTTRTQTLNNVQENRLPNENQQSAHASYARQNSGPHLENSATPKTAMQIFAQQEIKRFNTVEPDEDMKKLRRAILRDARAKKGTSLN